MSYSYIGHKTDSLGGVVHIPPYQEADPEEDTLPSTHYRATPVGLQVDKIKTDYIPKSVVIIVCILVVSLAVLYFAKKRSFARRTQQGSRSSLTSPILKVTLTDPPV